MFGIGLGEILLILFIVFIISPKEIPAIMRKIGRFMAGLEKFRKEITDVERGLREVPDEVGETRKARRGRPGGRLKSAAGKRKSAPKKSAAGEKKKPPVNRKSRLQSY